MYNFYIFGHNLNTSLLYYSYSFNKYFSYSIKKTGIGTCLFYILFINFSLNTSLFLENVFFFCFFMIIVHNIIDIIIFIGLQNKYTFDIFIPIVEDAIIIKFHKVWKIAKGNILFYIIASGTKANPNKLEAITLTKAWINVFPANIVVMCITENPKLLIIIALIKGIFPFNVFSNIPLNIISSENPAITVPMNIRTILIKVVLLKYDMFL